MNSLRTTKLILGPFETNCYIVDNGSEALIIDPAADGDCIFAELDKLKVKPVCVVLSHYHWDHVMGLGSFKGLPIYIHELDRPYFNNKRALISSLEVFGPRLTAKYQPVLEKLPVANNFLKDGDEVFGLKTIHTPGHSQGSICLYNKEQNELYSADTLFSGGIGRTDLPGGNSYSLATSLIKLSKLPEATHLYPGHGPETSLQAENRR